MKEEEEERGDENLGGKVGEGTARLTNGQLHINLKIRVIHEAQCQPMTESEEGVKRREKDGRRARMGKGERDGRLRKKGEERRRRKRKERRKRKGRRREGRKERDGRPSMGIRRDNEHGTS